MSAADEQPSDAGALSFAAGLAVARARQGLLTVAEIRAALDEAYRMGQKSVHQQHTTLRDLAAEFDANGNSRELGDPRAATWHKAADRLRATLTAPLAGQHTTDEEGR